MASRSFRAQPRGRHPCAPQASPARRMPPSRRVRSELHALSFFDEDDEPREQPAAAPQRGRRAAPPPTSRRCWSAAPSPVGGVVLLAPVLFFVVARRARARARRTRCKDYNREVSSIVAESDTQVGAAVLRAAQRRPASESPQDLQTNISGYRVQAEQQLKQAQGLDVPGRDEGRPAVAADRARVAPRRARRRSPSEIRTALGDEGEAADAAINADRRRRCRCSWPPTCSTDARVSPFIKHALDDARDRRPDDRSARSSCPGIEWLQPADGRRRARPAAHRPAAAASSGQPTGARPARHRARLASTVGDTTLAARRAEPAHRTAPTPTFIVKFTNQGENDEFDIKVTLRIEGGGKPIKRHKTVPTRSPQGEQADGDARARQARRRSAPP